MEDKISQMEGSFRSNFGKAVLMSAAVSAAAVVGSYVARAASENYLIWMEKKNRKPIGFIK